MMQNNENCIGSMISFSLGLNYTYHALATNLYFIISPRKNKKVVPSIKVEDALINVFRSSD